MKFGSLFTGIGGFDLGFERAGMSCAWQVEKDRQCLDVLRYHWPNVRKYEDIKNVGRELEAVDVICGGFPCQDVSIAGNREGLDGERSGLWYEFHRIIRELHPRWVVVENVPGLLSANDGIDFAVVVGGLARRIPAVPDEGWKNAGFVRGRPDAYGVAWRVLDSRYFGVAQRRRRVFIVASIGTGCAAKVLFEPASGTRCAETGGRQKSEVAGTISTRTGRGCQQEVRTNQLVITNSTLTTGLSKQNGENVIAAAITKNGVGVCGADDNQAQAGHIVTGTLCASGAGTARTGNSNEGDMLVEDVGAPRRLMPIECERLQGFPDNHTLWGMTEDGERRELADSPRYAQMGNAVTVPVIEWIGSRIMAVVD